MLVIPYTQMQDSAARSSILSQIAESLENTHIQIINGRWEIIKRNQTSVGSYSVLVHRIADLCGDWITNEGSEQDKRLILSISEELKRLSQIAPITTQSRLQKITACFAACFFCCPCTDAGKENQIHHAASLIRSGYEVEGISFNTL